MRQTLTKLYEGFSKTKTVIVAVVAVLYLVLMLQSGGQLLEWLLFLVVVVVYVLLPGYFWTKILKTKALAPDFTGPLCILLGCGFLAVVYCVSMYFSQLWLLFCLPPLTAAAGVWLLVREKKGGAQWPAMKAKLQPRPHQWMLMLLFSALLLFYTFYGVVKYAKPMAVGDILPNHDLLWNVGNAASFKLGFPPEDIRVSGVRLHYHYLTEMLAGILSLISGAQAYNIVAFYMQPLMLAAMVFCTWRLGRILWPQGYFKPLLFSYAPFLFSCASLWAILPNGWSLFNNSNITHLITNINAQTTAIIFLCIFLGLLIPAMRQKYRIGPVHFLLLLAAFFMLTFAKGPLAAIVVCSLVVTLLIGLFQKNTTWRGVLLGVLLAGMFLIVYIFMFSSGANDSMSLSYAGTLVRGALGPLQDKIWHRNYYLWLLAVPVLWVVQTFLSMLAQFPLYIRALLRDIHGFKTLAPERMLAQGAVAGGLLAYFIFEHYHFSQLYFLFVAIFFVNFIVVDGIDLLRRKPDAARHPWRARLQKLLVGATAVCTAISIVTTGFLYIHYMGSGGRQLLRNLGIIEKYPYDVVTTADDEAAMLWLAENTNPDIQFATNRIHTGARLEGISNLYSAYSGRQGYLDGFQYTQTNMGISDEMVEERLAVNNALFTAGTPQEEILRLCRENGIDYLVYSTQLPGDESQLSGLEKVFDSPTVRIYALPKE